MYVFIYIYISPPLRPHVQQKHSIIRGSDCKCTVLKLNMFSSPQQISDRVFLLEDCLFEALIEFEVELVFCCQRRLIIIPYLARMTPNRG